MNDLHTIGGWLVERAATSPGATAIDDGGVRISYGDLASRSQRLANKLREAGYGPGDRIASLTGNSADHIVLFFACALSGAALVPLSWRLTPRELGEALERAKPVLLATEDAHLTSVEEAADGGVPHALLGTTGIELAVPARQAQFGAAPEVRPAQDTDPLLIIFTSGSESRPKAVVLTHENCFWTNESLAGAVQLTADDVVLAMLPQFHVAAWNCQPLLALRRGATIVLERSFQPERVLHLIRERGVTAMMGVPTQYAMLANAPGFSSETVRSVRAALVGGATIPSAVASSWDAAGVALIQGYGLTEAGPNVACSAPGATQAGSIGRAYPHIQTRVVDVASGLVLEGAATGELQVRGPAVFSHYLDDVAATNAARDRGWLRTGDVAERDDTGLLRIVDRLKDIYISGGENVAPAEVERALLLHPLISDAAVVGVPDEVWGERGVAFVVTSGPLGEDEVLAHARTMLAGYKVPVRVAIVAELPRTSIEKLARSQLRAAARSLGEEGEHVRN